MYELNIDSLQQELKAIEKESSHKNELFFNIIYGKSENLLSDLEEMFDTFTSKDIYASFDSVRRSEELEYNIIHTLRHSCIKRQKRRLL